MRCWRSLGLIVMIAVTASVGCSMTNPTVRGQAPDNAGPIIGSAPGYGENVRAPYKGRHGQDFRTFQHFRDNNFGYEGGYYAPQDPNITAAGVPYTVDGAAGDPGMCPDCNNGQACPQSGCRRCGRGCGAGHGFPNHYQTYQYNWPNNMVYPQQPAPSGVVQYPYYTLRGPTDFFMK